MVIKDLSGELDRETIGIIELKDDFTIYRSVRFSN